MKKLKPIKKIFQLPSIFKENVTEALSSSTIEFPQLDIENLIDEWKVKNAGSRDGSKNIPNKNAEEFSASELKYYSTFYGLITERKNQAISMVNEYENQFRRSEVQKLISDIRNFGRSTKSAFNEIISSAKDNLTEFKNRLISFEKEYKEFKDKNNIQYEPNIPGSKTLFIGILLFELIIETILNGNFFADSNAFGLLGGLITALVLSLVNVLFLGYFFGKYIFWYKNHFLLSRKVFGWLSFLLFLAAGLIINFFISHYRLQSGIEYKNTFQNTVNTISIDPLNLDLNGWLLFLVGFSFSIIAFFTSYKMEDPYPLHEKIYKDTKRYRDEYVSEKEDYIDKLNSLKESEVKNIQNLIEKLKVNYNAAKSIIDDEERYLQKWLNATNYLEKVCSTVIQTYRNENERKRTESPPSYFNHKFEFKESFVFKNELNENGETLKKVKEYVDEIGNNLKKMQKQILDNHEDAREQFKEVEKLVEDL